MYIPEQMLRYIFLPHRKNKGKGVMRVNLFGGKEPVDGPHPRKEPRLTQPLTPEGLSDVFRDCVDFKKREVCVGDDPARRLTLCYLEGVVRNERVSDYILRPIAQNRALAQVEKDKMFALMRDGALYNLTATERTTTDQAATDLIAGFCIIFFPGRREVLSFFTGTEEKRAVGQPENEPSVKGARDSFVETVRTNTAMVRRRLRAPELRIAEHIVGRQTLTPVDVLWMDGIADPDTVAKVQERIAHMDIDGIQTTGNLEEYIIDRLDTPFPLVASTQRPDWFCGGLLEGRVGVLCEGQPMGWLLPGAFGQFFQTNQDKTSNWMMATALRSLRWLCMFITLLLPGLYVAMVTFQPEMIPVKLALSIAAAKREVPFSTVFEVLIMLLSFEVLQEAGLRLPGPIGQTVSILGGLVVGSAAVEARIVSPAVLIAVALAGIAGYTMPNQDLGGALRLWRFGLTILASVSGLFGLVLGCAVLVRHLAGLESFGQPYLDTTAGAVRRPLPLEKWRERVRRPLNRRNQR